MLLHRKGKVSPEPHKVYQRTSSYSHNDMGIVLLKLLIAEYGVLLVVFAFGKNWNMVLYWAGAIILNIAVLKGMN